MGKFLRVEDVEGQNVWIFKKPNNLYDVKINNQISEDMKYPDKKSLLKDVREHIKNNLTLLVEVNEERELMNPKIYGLRRGDKKLIWKKFLTSDEWMDANREVIDYNNNLRRDKIRKIDEEKENIEKEKDREIFKNIDISNDDVMVIGRLKKILTKQSRYEGTNSNSLYEAINNNGIGKKKLEMQDKTIYNLKVDVGGFYKIPKMVYDRLKLKEMD